MAFRGEIWLFPIRLPEAVKVEDKARAFLNSQRIPLGTLLAHPEGAGNFVYADRDCSIQYL